jgi:hypothetical protein
VSLTPEEHYVAHQLLIKIHPTEPKLVYAAIMMSAGTQKHKRNNKVYGWLRRRLISNLKSKTGTNHHNYGRPAPNRNIAHTVETKSKISDTKLSQHRKTPLSVKKKISEKLSGEHNPMFGKPSPNTGKADSAETKERKSIKAFNRPKISCIYCRGVSDPGNFSRSHGNNCKNKEKNYV